MVDERPEDGEASAEAARVKRAPPTIDLEATEVTTAKPDTAEQEISQDAESDAEAERASDAQRAAGEPPVSSSISPWVIAPFSGAVAAALVIAVGWLLGWPPVQPASQPVQPNAAQIDNLASRLAGLEQKVNKPSNDAITRFETLEKAQNSLRSEVANLREQSEKLAAALKDLKAVPQDSAATADLTAINERIAQLERSIHAQGAEIAQEGQKLANVKPADDLPLRRVVAAALLEVAVRHGDPYPTLLSSAKTLSPDPNALKPLDAFAATGVPNVFALNRELLAVVPKLSPSAQDNASGGSGIIDRLQSGAARLVRIERTDAVGNDRAATVARITAAALRNDFAEARRELETLAPSDRAPAQAWLDKADAREAALAASQKFADDAMAALAKPAQ